MDSHNSNQSSRNKDTGIALTLLIALYTFFSTGKMILLAVIAMLVATATVPVIFSTPGKFWLKFSELTGTIMSKIILTVVFFFIVFPIGFFRRSTGADPLQLRLWKQENPSVFRQRKQQTTPKKLELPY